MFKQCFSVVIYLVLSSQLLFSCQPKEDLKPENTETPGYFLVSSSEYQASPNGRVVSSNTANLFDVGELHATDKFTFIIANGGDKPLFDVNLTSDNNSFEVSPKNIGTLIGKNSSGISPTITVKVVHGLTAIGGPAPLLGKGRNKAIITMKGKTISNNDTLSVVGQFTISLEAKVVGLAIYNGEQQVTGPNNIPWKVDVSKTLKIVNTGNVTLDPMLYYFIPDPNSGYIRKDDGSYVLKPGESKDITTLVSENEHLYIDFSDKGTVVSTPIFNRPSSNDILRIMISI